MFFWQKSSGVTLAFIQPGKPTQNAFVENLNGRFRAECLNQHWFRGLEDAQEIIDEWRYYYNHERLQSTLNYVTRMAFANRAAQNALLNEQLVLIRGEGHDLHAVSAN